MCVMLGDGGSAGREGASFHLPPSLLPLLGPHCRYKQLENYPDAVWVSRLTAALVMRTPSFGTRARLPPVGPLGDGVGLQTVGGVRGDEMVVYELGSL